MYSVWSVKFSNLGYYFVSAGHDKTVRLWTTEQWQCVRILVGHFSDVDCVAFHPNANYVASGAETFFYFSALKILSETFG
jgi:transcription initiation factor TFIID subunit 5